MSIKIAVLISGSGTTLQNIIDCCASGAIDGEVVCVVASKENAYGITRAEKAGIPNTAVVRKYFEGNALWDKFMEETAGSKPSKKNPINITKDFSEAIWDFVKPHEPDLIVLAGFMSLLNVPSYYDGRIMNVHPALIPAFCGKGMYGHHVHEAVLEYGAKLSGVTVHYVDGEYDNGPIIMQSTVQVQEDDTPETLAERVQAEERAIYPKAIQLFAENRLKLDGRIVRILP